MKIDFNEEFIETAIKNYLKSIDHQGRLEQFEKDIIDKHAKALHINGTFSTSAIQLQDAVEDGKDVYYDGVLIVPYRYWLMKSNSQCEKSDLDSSLEILLMNQWKMLYNLLPNIKKAMDTTYKDNNERITKENINEMVEYIKMSLDNILKM